MFGYVTVCKSSLSEQDAELFNAYYCGLCHSIGSRCSHSARMGLSYDIAFLALVLSAVGEKDCEMKSKRCIVHPTRPRICVENDSAVDYAADMGVILSYLKLLDDLRDERSIKAAGGILFFLTAVRKAKNRYPSEYAHVRSCLDDLSRLEKNSCTEIDETADCFAKILEILFTPSFITDAAQRRILASLGYNIGRWIYIIDAYNDLEKDAKKHGYNTFLKRYGSLDASEIKNELRPILDTSLTFTLENAAAAYNLLDVRRNKNVLDNIIYSALKMKQDYILGEKDESL